MSAFRHCILLGYLLSLNRKLFQIDRQTECCAECVNWNYHIQQFPSPGAGLELSSVLMSRECQEQFYLLIIPHLFECLVFLANSLPRCFQECLAGQCKTAGAYMARRCHSHTENIYIHLCEKKLLLSRVLLPHVLKTILVSILLVMRHWWWWWGGVEVGVFKKARTFNQAFCLNLLKNLYNIHG